MPLLLLQLSCGLEQIPSDLLRQHVTKRQINALPKILVAFPCHRGDCVLARSLKKVYDSLGKNARDQKTWRSHDHHKLF